MMIDRIYMELFISVTYNIIEGTYDYILLIIIRILPKYMTKRIKRARDEKIKKMKLEQENNNNIQSESVEPIIQCYLTSCQDTVILIFFPYVVYLFMQYRVPIGLPGLFNISVSDMIIYMFYQLSLVFFQPLGDIFIYGQLELFNGWKVSIRVVVVYVYSVVCVHTIHACFMRILYVYCTCTL